MNEDLNQREGKLSIVVWILIIIVLVFIYFFVFKTAESPEVADAVINREDQNSISPQTIEDLIAVRKAYSKDDFLGALKEDYPISSDFPVSSIGHEKDSLGNTYISYFDYRTYSSKEDVITLWVAYAESHKLNIGTGEDYDLFFIGEDESLGIWINESERAENTSVSVEIFRK